MKLTTRLALGFAAVCVVAVVAFLLQRDPRLPPEVAAVRLQALVKSPSPFQCRRIENDGSIQLDDVDYYCERRDGVTGYWIGTDGDGITEYQPSF